MKKFIVIYHATPEATSQTNALTPEQQAAGMQAWMTWAEKCGEHLIDLGSPLVNGQRLHHGGTMNSSDKDVTGYSIMQAENMDQAKSLLEGHPHLAWNADCSIEVHETASIPGIN